MSARKHVMVVLSNAAPGRENEYNEWYTNVHLPEVLQVRGLVAAQRFKLGKVQREGAPPSQWQYAAIYEMETDDPGASMAEIKRQTGTGEMRVSSAIKDAWAYVYEPITERVLPKARK
jgi:hypothetical protein